MGNGCGCPQQGKFKKSNHQLKSAPQDVNNSPQIANDKIKQVNNLEAQNKNQPLASQFKENQLDIVKKQPSNSNFKTSKIQRGIPQNYERVELSDLNNQSQIVNKQINKKQKSRVSGDDGERVHPYYNASLLAQKYQEEEETPEGNQKNKITESKLRKQYEKERIEKEAQDKKKEKISAEKAKIQTERQRIQNIRISENYQKLKIESEQHNKLQKEIQSLLKPKDQKIEPPQKSALLKELQNHQTPGNDIDQKEPIHALCSVCKQFYDTDKRSPFKYCQSKAHIMCEECLKEIMKEEEPRCPTCKKIILPKNKKIYKEIYNEIHSFSKHFNGLDWQMKQLYWFFHLYQCNDYLANININMSKGLLLNKIKLTVNSQKMFKIQPMLKSLKKLTYINFEDNKIQKIQHLQKHFYLQHLNLSNNLLTKIQNLQKNTVLKELYLSLNQITKMQNLDTMIHLEVLDLNYNHITNLRGIQNCEKLKVLLLNHNQISWLEYFTVYKRLQKFHLFDNPINRRPLVLLKGFDEKIQMTSFMISLDGYEGSSYLAYKEAYWLLTEVRWPKLVSLSLRDVFKDQDKEQFELAMKEDKKGLKVNWIQ